MSDTAAHGEHEAHPPHLEHHFDTPEQQMESGKLGMWLFLAQELLFFGGVFCAYAIYRSLHPELFVYGASQLNWKMGAVNTVVLICSSLTMAWAVRAAQVGYRKQLIWMLVATQLFAGCFLVVKYFEYSEKIQHGLLWGTHFDPGAHGGEGDHGALDAPEGLAPTAMLASLDASVAVAAAPAAVESGADAEHAGDETHAEVEVPPNAHIFFGMYFVMTGLHLLHVLAGMVVIGWLMKGAIAGKYGPSYYNPVDIVGLYWHLVDLVWIFLFPLLYLI